MKNVSDASRRVISEVFPFWHFALFISHFAFPLRPLVPRLRDHRKKVHDML
jgi:hypothetical protein